MRRVRPGLDYSVAHYGAITRDGRLDATLCFVDDLGEDKQVAWDSGEVRVRRKGLPQRLSRLQSAPHRVHVFMDLG